MQRIVDPVCQGKNIAMRILFLIFPVMACISSCKKDSLATPESTGGMWVEIKDEKDTLRFYTIDNSRYFDLSTGVKNQNGHPAYPVGPYMLLTKQDSIRPIWLPRSSIDYTYYYYKIQHGLGKLTVGNFYKFDSPDQLLQFRHIP